MTLTPNLGLPFIEGSQAQKHVTHNEALRILDAAVQISVLDLTRAVPPSSPAESDRHVVASGATGAWAGHVNAIATWQDGAWAFLAPKTGWCIWSSADDVMFVFDGTHWRDLRDLPVTLDNAVHVGVNTTASSPNLLSVKSNAALLSSINVADGGSGDARLQISKESSSKTASVVFSDAFSGRAEFGLVGSDAFKLKVSADGSAWTDAFGIDQGTGNLALSRGIALTGVIAPAQITANQNDYNPAGIASASVVQLSSDASRNVSGLTNGAEGRVVSLINTGSQPITLLDESTSSLAANRFSLGGNFVIATRHAAVLRYDGTAARWQAIARSTAGVVLAANNLSDLASAATARGNLGLGSAALRGVDDYPRTDAAQSLSAAQRFQGIANLSPPMHCGRLSRASATALSFVPCNGDLIRINGLLYPIPAAGIAGAANTSVFVNGTGGSNLAASTLYYVYAFINVGTVTVDFCTTAHATSATAGNIGTEIKSGDDTRSLIGMIRTNASSQFADAATQRFVRSWFNDPGIVGKLASAPLVTGLGSATSAEIASSLRVEFLTWSGENVHLSVIGYGYNTTAGVGMTLLPGFDTTAEPVGASRFDTYAASVNASTALSSACDKNDLSEGYHFGSGFFTSSGGTAAFQVATQLAAKR